MRWRASLAEQRRLWGLTRAVRWIAMEALERLAGFHLYVIHVRRLREDDAIPTLPSGLSLRIVEHDELLDAARDPALGLDPAMVEAALARGDVCVGAFEPDRLVAYVWRAFGPTPVENDLWIHFERPYPYAYKAFTRPEYRGRHVQQPLTLATDRLCLARGFTHTISYVATHNYPSLVSNWRRGNETVGHAGYLRWFGRCVTFRTPGVKRLGVRFVTGGPRA